MILPVHHVLVQRHFHLASCSLYNGALYPVTLSSTELRLVERLLALAQLAGQPFKASYKSFSFSILYQSLFSIKFRASYAILHHHCHLQEVINGEETEPDLGKNWLNIKAWIGLRPCRHCTKDVDLKEIPK